MSLEDLLERYVALDDEAAMAELVQRTRGKLLAVARRICKGDAEDAVQAAYLALAKRGGLGGAPVLPWLLTAVARIAYRSKATRAREHAIAERLAPTAAPPEPPEIAIGGEEAELLRRELWKLPAEYRDALQLRYLHGLSGAETARLLGVNDSTLRTRLQRGRLMLRSRLGRVLFVMPWLFRDASAALVGGTMKMKFALVALLLAALGVVYVTSRESAPAPRAAGGEAARVSGAGERAATVADIPAKAATDERPVHMGGVVVDEAGAPLDHVRVIARASLADESMRLQFEIARQQGRDIPKDAHFRPELIDDALLARTPLAETDASGRFAIRRPPEPRQTLLFVREGYAVRGEKDLGPEMRVALQVARTIRGVVTDTAGAPIPRAGVRASTGLLEETQDSVADDEGRYCFRFLQSGIRSMSAYANGYDSEFRRAPGDAEDFRLRRMFLVVDVTDAESTQRLVTACARLATADGHPFGFVRGTSSPGRSSSGYGRCLVGPDLQKVLEPGKTAAAVVHVFAPGYVPVLEPVEFRGGEEPPHLRVALRPGDGPPSLAGQVKGAGVAHIVVRNPNYLMTEEYEYVTEADTKHDGRFLFSGLPRQDYLLIVTAPGMGKVTRRFAPVTDDIEIQLEPAAILEVLAQDRRGAPVVGTTIHVELPDGKRHWTAKTDERGWAVFDELPAEEVLVAAVVEGWNRPIHDKGIPTAAVTPKAGTRTPLTVTVPEPLAVHIQVRDETQRAHEGVILSFETRSTGVVRVVGKTEYDRLQALRLTTGPDGTAEASLYQGEYDVMLRDGPTPVRVAILKVGEDASNRAEVIVPRRRTVVRGRLRVYGTDEPIRNGVLLVRDAGDTKAAATIRTDAEGRFEVRGLARGRHMVLLLTGREENLPSHGDIDLTGRDEADVEFFAVPKGVAQPCEVAVTVRSRTSGPLAGASVSVSAKVGDGWATLSRGNTDAEGRVVLPALESECYRIWARAEGHELADVTVERKGQRAVADIELATKP